MNHTKAMYSTKNNGIIAVQDIATSTTTDGAKCIGASEFQVG